LDAFLGFLERSVRGRERERVRANGSALLGFIRVFGAECPRERTVTECTFRVFRVVCTRERENAD